MGKESGVALNDVKVRFQNGDPFVIEILQQIGELAEKGNKAIENRDYDTLHKLMDKNFNLRRKIMPIRDTDLALVETARKCGASAKFAGSGGSIIGMYRDDEMLNYLKVELFKVKARVIKPFIQ
jgi:glucuronokinase